MNGIPSALVIREAGGVAIIERPVVVVSAGMYKGKLALLSNTVSCDQLEIVKRAHHVGCIHRSVHLFPLGVAALPPLCSHLRYAALPPGPALWYLSTGTKVQSRSAMAMGVGCASARSGQAGKGD